jgi:hypothetical protein
MSKTIREIAVQCHKDLEDDKKHVMSSKNDAENRIKQIDEKINSLENEITALKIERAICVVNRDKYDEIFKEDVITQIALRDFLKNRYDTII